MRRLSASLLVVAAIVACDEMDDPEDDLLGHNCSLKETNYYWSSNNLQLRHNDSRMCPADVETGDPILAGGTLIDLDVDYPDTPGDWDAKRGTMEVWNTDDGCNSYGAIVDESAEDFRWLDWNNNGALDWATQIYVNYLTGTGQDSQRDCPTFKVLFWHGLLDKQGIAWTIVDYSDNH